MATEARTRRGSAALALLFMVLCLAGYAAQAASAAPADPSGSHASYGPGSDKPPPESWSQSQTGVDSKGNYCQLYRAEDCRPLSSAEAAKSGAPGDPQTAESRSLQEWRDKADHSARDFEKLDAFLTSCVEDGDTFQSCIDRGARKYPSMADGAERWVAGKISEAASDALQETASYIANAVVWLLEEFADVFNVASSINLSSSGVSNLAGIGTALSAVVATFLLLMQFGKVSLSRQGGPAATALTGLVKWGVISSVYFLAVQTALAWSDAVSNWIVNYTFGNGGSSSEDAATTMRDQLDRMFSGLVAGRTPATGPKSALVSGDHVDAPAVGVIIVVGIVCILAIGALWVEILLRQAGIMILVATMPVILAGQMSDVTRPWWPRARNTLIVLVLMKPLIMICFSVGFFAMSPGRGVQNMIVGLVIFLMACASWPVLAKFVTPARISTGISLASGLFGSRDGGSPASASPAYLTGAGAVGGGVAYTRALEEETAGGAAPTPRPESAKRPFWSTELREAGMGGPAPAQRHDRAPKRRGDRQQPTARTPALEGRTSPTRGPQERDPGQAREEASSG